MKTVGIVGMGYVGTAMHKFFAHGHQHHHVYTYDTKFDHISKKNIINKCDVVLICVPTPSDPNTLRCDTSIVEE